MARYEICGGIPLNGTVNISGAKNAAVAILPAAQLVSALGEDFIENAQLFSKEVENCAENMDALMDAVYDHPAFSPDNLTALLTNS